MLNYRQHILIGNFKIDYNGQYIRDKQLEKLQFSGVQKFIFGIIRNRLLNCSNGKFSEQSVDILRTN